MVRIVVDMIFVILVNFGWLVGAASRNLGIRMPGSTCQDFTTWTSLDVRLTRSE
jgi:hypothetical protein